MITHENHCIVHINERIVQYVAYISIKLLLKKDNVRKVCIVCYCRKGRKNYIHMIELNNIRVSNNNKKGCCISQVSVRIQLGTESL